MMADEIWRQCARIALGVLGWSPQAFWQATPAELMLAMEGITGGASAPPAPLTRAEFDALQQRFPDR